MGIFFAEIYEIHVEFQGILNIQNNLEKEEQSWKTHTSQLQNILHFSKLCDNGMRIQLNITEKNPDINGQLLFSNAAQITQWGKQSS